MQFGATGNGGKIERVECGELPISVAPVGRDERAASRWKAPTIDSGLSRANAKLRFKPEAFA